MRVAAAALAVFATLAATASGRPAVGCSASRYSTTLPVQKIPLVVWQMRQRIVTAATACDYAYLERVGRERGGFRFRTSGGGSAAAYWAAAEARGERPMAMLVLALRSPVTRDAAGDYVWPRTPGALHGWQTGLSRSGDWLFFLRRT